MSDALSADVMDEVQHPSRHERWHEIIQVFEVVILAVAALATAAANDAKLQAVYVRRFTPDYRAAFNAWLKTDPLNNPNAPAGPGYMPQYHNLAMAQAAKLNDQAAATFDAGTAPGAIDSGCRISSRPTVTWKPSHRSSPGCDS